MQVRLFKPRVSEDAIAAVADVLRSGWLGLGPRTAAFEQMFATYAEVPRAVAVNTGTSALHIAVKLLRLEPGTEVITSPVTFVAANTVLLYERLTPVFADVDPRTGNLTPASVAERVTGRTGAILLTHLGGYACDLDGFAELADRHRLPIIEDCAHACGARYRGVRIGARGNLCAFSFDPIKNLTTGDGGMLVPRDAADDQRARVLRNMGITTSVFERYGRTDGKTSWEYDVAEVGHRYHMNDIQAALGLAQLRELDAGNTRRRMIAARYACGLGAVAGISLPAYDDDRESSYHLFLVLAERRNALAAKLSERGITVGVHYRRNDEYRIFQRADLPHADTFCDRVLSLPMHVDLTDDDIDGICGVIAEGW